ncbi:hypothetical protein BST61_g72 [Cercospora zeina]
MEESEEIIIDSPTEAQEENRCQDECHSTMSHELYSDDRHLNFAQTLHNKNRDKINAYMRQLHAPLPVLVPQSSLDRLQALTSSAIDTSNRVRFFASTRRDLTGDARQYVALSIYLLRFYPPRGQPTN